VVKGASQWYKELVVRVKGMYRLDRSTKGG
jgi:hypothetical protein